MRRFMMVVVAMIFVVTSVGASLAMEQGNKRKGKYTYRKVYKSCSERGEVASTKPPLNPSDKTQAEWEAMFAGRDYTAFGCQEEWQKMSDEEITDIFTYLYAHASDSPTPLKCK
jgi:hypothetical protein